MRDNYQLEKLFSTHFDTWWYRPLWTTAGPIVADAESHAEENTEGLGIFYRLLVQGSADANQDLPGQEVEALRRNVATLELDLPMGICLKPDALREWTKAGSDGISAHKDLGTDFSLDLTARPEAGTGCLRSLKFSEQLAHPA